MVRPWIFLDLKREQPPSVLVSIFLRLWGSELPVSFGTLPRLKMNSLFHLTFSYPGDSCVSAVQE